MNLADPVSVIDLLVSHVIVKLIDVTEPREFAIRELKALIKSELFCESSNWD